jgi:hypothetical protein
MANTTKRECTTEKRQPSNSTPFADPQNAAYPITGFRVSQRVLTK